MRQETALWLRQAQEDLITAQVNLDGGRFYAASIFSQQAAEKALKALILEQTGATPPRSHDLVALGRRIGAPLKIAETLEQLNYICGITLS
jgi:HEPN domain-containing protein